jgi:high-affinity nickel-transport protein
VAPATETVKARGDATNAGSGCSTTVVRGSKSGRRYVLTHITGVFRNLPAQTRRRVVALYVGLIALNVVAWILAFAASAQYALILGNATLAYTFGLRHAVDADHIAAIDNVTRKLMQDGQRPAAVGFFFSLGHSTIVVGLSVLLAAATQAVNSHLNRWHDIGSVIGTTVSAVFLLVIAMINLLVLIDIYRMWRGVARGGSYDERKVEEYLDQRGLLARMLRPVIRQVDRSWKMYPVGVLFGLGFDTASEIGLLGLSTSASAGHLPIYYILIYPLLFLAGMSLIDTTDGVLMLGAYGWAFIKPIRKLYYNLNITLISVLVALVIGGIEALSVVSQEASFSGPFWDFVGNIDLGSLGYFIVAILFGSWFVSTLVYRVKRYDLLEALETPAPASAP